MCDPLLRAGEKEYGSDGYGDADSSYRITANNVIHLENVCTADVENHHLPCAAGVWTLLNDLCICFCSFIIRLYFSFIFLFHLISYYIDSHLYKSGILTDDDNTSNK